jgi:hypothetical protein
MKKSVNLGRVMRGMQLDDMQNLVFMLMVDKLLGNFLNKRKHTDMLAHVFVS